MYTSSNEDEETEKHGTETGSEALVVVSRTSPLGEAIVQEMIVAFALWAA